MPPAKRPRHGHCALGTGALQTLPKWEVPHEHHGQGVQPLPRVSGRVEKRNMHNHLRIPARALDPQGSNQKADFAP
eukprot:scaffold98835_cov33-Tisochrysis_lutea.AAC.1